MKDLDLDQLANVTGGFLSPGQLPPGAPPPYNPFGPDPRGGSIFLPPKTGLGEGLPGAIAGSGAPAGF